MYEQKLPLSAIRQTYLHFDTPVDTLATNPTLLDQFAASLNLACGTALSPSDVLRILLNARKRSQLPRLRRQYHGRYQKEVQHD